MRNGVIDLGLGVEAAGRDAKRSGAIRAESLQYVRRTGRAR
jgi:hypothetical protein